MNHAVAPGDAAPLPIAAAPASAAAPRLFRAVHRAIGDARRGVPVVISGMTRLDAGRDGAGEAEDYVVVPAETISEETLAIFAAATRGEPLLLLSASPAAAHYAAPSVTAVAVASLSAAGLRRLADPALNLGDERAAAVVHGPVPASLDPAAAMGLAKLARLLPATLVGARISGDPQDLLEVTARDILDYPRAAAASLVRIAEASVPMADAPDARVVAFRPPDGGIEHLAILIGQPEGADAPLTRVHSECFTGDLLGSLRCDCGPQFHQAIRRMSAEGAGVVLYMAQEGRGIGLVNKLRAYTLQDAGLDTLDANRALGFEADERSFAPAATMLKALGITRIRLLTNNPDKVRGLETCGIDVAGRVSHAIAANGVNDGYLATKVQRFGHLIG